MTALGSRSHPGTHGEIITKNFTADFSKELLFFLEKDFCISHVHGNYLLHPKTAKRHYGKHRGILVGGTTYKGEAAKRVIMEQALGIRKPRGGRDLGYETKKIEDSINLENVDGKGTHFVERLMQADIDFRLVMLYFRFLDQSGYGDYLLESG